MSSSKRASMAPQQGPRPPVKLSSTLTVADTAVLIGNHSIVVMSESVLQPRCRLESMVGSLLIGKRCIIHERTHIGAPPSGGQEGGVTIGDYVTIEGTAIIEAGGTEIGEATTIGNGARIGAGAKIGKNCTIAPKSVVLPGDEIPDSTVVYSNGMRRVDRRELGDMRLRAQVRQIQVLRSVIKVNPAWTQEK